MQDVFTSYETGLTHLLRRLGQDHPRYTEALTLQSRLLENIAQARRYGDTDGLKHTRAQIVDILNDLALDTLGTSFNELCGLARDAGVLAMAPPGERERSTDTGWDVTHRAYHVPFQAPPLPAYFVPRPEVSESLKAQLLADGATPGVLVVSAIHGLGGIGKSTIAAHISAALSTMGYRVMQIGCDPKSDSTNTLRGGRFIPTVLDTLRQRDRVEIEDVVHEGFNGILTIEVGGPEPGVGCAGRGILTAIKLSLIHI